MKIYSSVISGSLNVLGDITAETYITKTSVSTVTQSFSSGSTIFGDSLDDTHQFTGSLFISGSKISLDDGNNNIGIGANVFAAHAGGGGRNIAIGSNVMKDTDANATSLSSRGNVFLGYNVGSNTMGGTAATEFNVIIGDQAAVGALDGAQNNTAIGRRALHVLTQGDYNVAIGMDAGYELTTGANNVLIGAEAGNSFQTTSNTVLIGYSAGDAINSTDADGTVAIGYQAGDAITDGAGNTAIGYQALSTVSTGDSNTAIGDGALKLVTGQYNVAVGYRALDSADGGESNNIGIGTNVMGHINHDDSDHNVAIGDSALLGGTGTVKRNIAIGSNAMGTGISNNDQTGTVAISC